MCIGYYVDTSALMCAPFLLFGFAFILAERYARMKRGCWNDHQFIDFMAGLFSDELARLGSRESDKTYTSTVRLDMKWMQSLYAADARMCRTIPTDEAMQSWLTALQTHMELRADTLKEKFDSDIRTQWLDITSVDGSPMADMSDRGKLPVYHNGIVADLYQGTKWDHQSWESIPGDQLPEEVKLKIRKSLDRGSYSERRAEAIGVGVALFCIFFTTIASRLWEPFHCVESAHKFDNSTLVMTMFSQPSIPCGHLYDELTDGNSSSLITSTDPHGVWFRTALVSRGLSATPSSLEA